MPRQLQIEEDLGGSPEVREGQGRAEGAPEKYDSCPVFWYREYGRHSQMCFRVDSIRTVLQIEFG